MGTKEWVSGRHGSKNDLGFVQRAGAGMMGPNATHSYGQSQNQICLTAASSRGQQGPGDWDTQPRPTRDYKQQKWFSTFPFIPPILEVLNGGGCIAEWD